MAEMDPRMSKPSPPSPATAKKFLLRFISGKYQGGEFPLHPGREIVIGRSSDLDMVLVEDMVSRKHAKIGMSGDQIVIQDLGSTNGTFVNGEKIKRTRLKEGDRILVGTSIIKVVVAQAAAENTEEQARQAMQEVSQQPSASSSRTMSGMIEEIPLPDLLQLFSTSKKSGVLVVRGDAGVGRIFLRKGQIFFASINDSADIAPPKSIYRMLRWERGGFELQAPEERQVAEEIDQPTEAILMEGLRQLDEIKAISENLPDTGASLSMAMPLVQPLRDLSPGDLDVLQLAYNYGHVETVLNKSPAVDLDTWRSLLKLIKGNYLRVE